ncbi:histidine kinase [Micromonospora sp. NPDC000089]|uniref:histidine kinase n=1 Tax=unclassified Micromonospora TaxID=2617518 RepID=UPI0036A2C489
MRRRGRWPGRRWAGDGALWVLLCAPVAYARLTPPPDRLGVPVLLGLLVLLAAAVVASRRRPVVAVLLVLLGSAVDGNMMFALLAVSYRAGRCSERVAPMARLFAAVAVGGAVLHLAVLRSGVATWFLLSCVLLFAGVLPWLVGRYRRQHQALTTAGWEYAEAVRREQRVAAERVRLAERARIAREMHDSLGHELSLIALRAAALEVAPDLPPARRSAAGELRAGVAAATDRLHGIIGLLRDEPAGTAPVGETVTELVDRARAAGMVVRLWCDPAADDLPEPARLAARRVIREALTNAARHAPGAPVTVTVEVAPDAVAVRVVNGPSPHGPPAPRPSTGTGLLALRERARLAGGALAAGPSADGGFAVTVNLPLAAAAGPLDGTSPGADPAPVGPTARRAPDALAARGWGLDPLADPIEGSTTEPGAVVRAARRGVRRSLLLALGGPPPAAALLSLVYYPVATAGAELDREHFDRMRVGAARSELAGLPRREVSAPVDQPAPPPGASCVYYTDGNFPLARPTWRLCFTDGRLTGKSEVTE